MGTSNTRPTPEDNRPDCSSDVTEALAYDLVVADERIASLETDVEVYREVLLASFDALRHLTIRLDKLTARYHQLADEYRRLREDVLITAGADA